MATNKTTVNDEDKKLAGGQASGDLKPPEREKQLSQIGRASCRERVF